MSRRANKRGRPGQGEGAKRIQHYLTPSLRELPAWAWIISILFTSLSGTLSLALAVTALIVTDYVALYHAVDSLFLLSLLGVTALLLALALNLARNFALINAPSRHHALSNKVDIFLAVAVTLGLSTIHPLMASGIVVMALILFCATLIERFFEPADPEALGPAEIKHLLSGREPENLLRELQRKPKTTLVFEPLCRFAGAIAGMATLLIGGWLAADKFITIGGMISGVLMATWCAEPMVELARRRAWSRRERAETVADKDQEDEPTDDTPEPDELEDDDALSGLKAVHLQVNDRRSGKELLGPVDFDIAAGEATAITGPPGSGKSIMLKAVVCNQPHPDLKVSGSTYLKGWTLKADGNWFDAVSVVYVPQHPVLLPGSPMENLLCFEVHDDEDAAETAARKALAKLDVFGLEADRIFDEDDVFRLSASQQHMICLARALLLNPDLLILDMPDAGLPQSMLPSLCDALHTIQTAGTAVLLSSANRMLLERCNEVMIIQDGYVADRGTPDEVLARHGSSWSRLTVKRTVEEEKRLHAWLRTHFKRSHDKEMLQRARALASEFLILSCSDVVGDAEDIEEEISFDFRWDTGFCTITMHDEGDPISQTRLRATEEGQLGNKPEDVALRELMSQADGFDQLQNDDPDGPRRIISAKLAVENERHGSSGR